MYAYIPFFHLFYPLLRQLSMLTVTIINILNSLKKSELIFLAIQTNKIKQLIKKG